VDAHVVYECEVCWARAESAEAIEHVPGLIHPPVPEINRLVFPYICEPSAGMLGRQT